MNLDIVEIGLNFMTDGFAFEKLASEVMREEGYHDIKRLQCKFCLAGEESPEKLEAVIDTTPVWKPVVEALKNLTQREIGHQCHS